MQIIYYYNSDRQEYWLSQIEKSDWSAGKYLHKLLRDNNFKANAGEKSDVLMLTDGDKLVSFCTYSEKDDIQPTELTPWIGFVYTFPEYRGNRFAGKLIDEAEKFAKSENVSYVFISTNHIGLYEKYGFEFYKIMNDINGEPSRVYRKYL